MNLHMYIAVFAIVASVLVACLIGYIRTSKQKQRDLRLALMREAEIRLFRFLP